MTGESSGIIIRVSGVQVPPPLPTKVIIGIISTLVPQGDYMMTCNCITYVDDSRWGNAITVTEYCRVCSLDSYQTTLSRDEAIDQVLKDAAWNTHRDTYNVIAS